MRHRLLGDCAQPSVESPRHAAGKEPRRGCCRAGESESVGAKTERERDYLAALGAMYADYDKVDHRTRLLAYAKAMEHLAARYPNDDEAQIYYALALNTSAPPDDKTYANQLKGAAIWKRSPSASRHPGVAHYLIPSLYDYPPIARQRHRSRPDRYAKIAPAAAHALHMPSHSSRVGYWRSRSIPISLRGVSRRKRRISTMSCMPWTTWSMPICSSGQDKKAKDVIDEMKYGHYKPTGPRSVCAGCFAGALRGGNAATGSCGGASDPPQPAAPGAGDHLFCPRGGSARSGQFRPPPTPTSPSWPRCRDKASSRPRTPIGPEQVDIPEADSPPPGCSTPKASDDGR